jgi:hypothetical protein
MTLFDVLPSFGAATAAALGAALGARLIGIGGAAMGAAVGCMLGMIVGSMPYLLSLRLLRRSYNKKSVADLRADLRRPDCFNANTILLELKARGEDIRTDLPIVLDLLTADDAMMRPIGWAALTTAYPELAATIPNYRIFDTPENCRKIVAVLRPPAGVV